MVRGDVTAGMLVHRLVESRGLAVMADDEAELTYARGLLRPEERASLQDIDATVRTAVASWRGLQNQPEISRLLATGRRYHEVPFSLRTELNGAPSSCGGVSTAWFGRKTVPLWSWSSRPGSDGPCTSGSSIFTSKQRAGLFRRLSLRAASCIRIDPRLPQRHLSSVTRTAPTRSYGIHGYVFVRFSCAV